MEILTEEMKALNKEFETGAEQLKKTINEIRSVHSILEQDMIKLLTHVRSKKDAISRELKTALSDLNAVKSFFMNQDYKEQITRLKEFVNLCEKFQVFVENGTIEAITDIYLKLEGGSNSGRE